MPETSLAIATPIARRPETAYMLAIFATFRELASHGIAVSHQILQGVSILPTARSVLVSHAMDRHPLATHLLLVDDDMAWDPKDVIRLLEHKEPLVGVAAPIRGSKPGAIDFGAIVTGPPDARGLAPARAVGAAFLLVSRDALESMNAAYPELRVSRRGASYTALFHQTIASDPPGAPPELLGEDYSFCKRWRDIGGTVLVDVDVAIEHVGVAPRIPLREAL